MKKIAIIITSLRGGGAERIVSYLINEGHKEFEFHLILLHREIDYQLPLSDNIKIVELDRRQGSKYMGVLKIPLLARKLKKYLTENNIETTLSLLNRPNIIACYVKKSGWKGKVIISERADTLAYYHSIPFGLFMISLVRRYYHYADVVTVISKGIANSLKTLGIEDCKVIYNPIYVSPCHDNDNSKNVSFTFINIGRLEKQKNHVLLLKAFAELRNPNCKLIIVGKGKLLEQLEKLSVSLGIEDKVTFMGYQSNIESCLESADCFVFSSDYEGFGNVIIEALNSGVPVISTDCPYGPREILAPDTDEKNLLKNGIELAKYGILTPAGSANDLADAMRKIMDNDDLRNKYCERAPLRAADFDIKNISKQYFELF